MTHVRGGRTPALGLSAGATAAVSYGANVIVPGSGPIVAVAVGVLDNLFGGARDKVRQARETWFEQGARQGSVLAARFLIGGTQNTAGNESPMYHAGIERLLNDAATAPTMRAAMAQGPWWDTTDDASSSRSRAAVEDELVRLGSSQPSPSSSPSRPPPAGADPGAQRVPGMTTTAAFNWMPYALAAGGLLLVAVVVPQFVRPSRRR